MKSTVSWSSWLSGLPSGPSAFYFELYILPSFSYLHRRKLVAMVCVCGEFILTFYLSNNVFGVLSAGCLVVRVLMSLP